MGLGRGSGGTSAAGARPPPPPLQVPVLSSATNPHPLPPTTRHLPRYNFDLNKGGIHLSWFNGGETNVAYNCLDKHVLEGNGDRTCFFWEGNDEGVDSKTSYKELLEMVCQVRTGPGRAWLWTGDAARGIRARAHSFARTCAGLLLSGSLPSASPPLALTTPPRLVLPTHPPTRSPQIANYMKSVGVGKGDDVTIYMPMIPELPAVMVRQLSMPGAPCSNAPA